MPTVPGAADERTAAARKSLDYVEPGMLVGLGSGEGLFLVHITGPGHVTLQTLPFGRTARRVMQAASGGGERSGSGLLGNILGD